MIFSTLLFIENQELFVGGCDKNNILMIYNIINGKFIKEILHEKFEGGTTQLLHYIYNEHKYIIQITNNPKILIYELNQ